MENNEDICLNSSISSWIIDYYFRNIQSKQRYIIGINDMLMICQIIHSSLTLEEFFSLCKNKLKQIKKNFFLEKYNQYLNEYNLIDIIDIFHQCQFDLFNKTIVLSNENIHNQIDQLFFDYFIQLSSTTSSTDDIKTILTNENLRKKEIFIEQINNKNYLKHTLCMYLSLLMNKRNEYAFNHCLGIEQNLTIYENLLSYRRHDDQSFDIQEKSSNDLKEFVEQLRRIIEENEDLKIESNITFRKLLELISLQLQKNNQYNSIIKDVIEELCQYFQTIILSMNFTSSIESASSEAKLSQSIAYLSAKQTIDLPFFLANHASSHPLQLTSATIEKYRSLDLSTIHETSFEVDESPDSIKIIPLQSMVKRQPLREIDINTFNNEERNIENEKKSVNNLIEFTLVSDGDKENLPVIRKKRSILSTKNDPPNKKQKKIDEKSLEIGQKMITNFFQSTN